MNIARFTTLEAATAKRDYYNALARHITSPADFTLVDIQKHTTDNVWWFDFDGCVANGGLHKADIQADMSNLDTVNLDHAGLITQGYLPNRPYL